MLNLQKQGLSDLSQESYLLYFLPQVLHLPPHGETRFRGVVLLSASSAEGCVDKRNKIASHLKASAFAVLFQMIWHSLNDVHPVITNKVASIVACTTAQAHHVSSQIALHCIETMKRLLKNTSVFLLQSCCILT